MKHEVTFRTKPRVPHRRMELQFGHNMPLCLMDARHDPEIIVINDAEHLGQFCANAGGVMYYQSRSGLSGAGWIPACHDITELQPWHPDRRGKWLEPDILWESGLVILNYDQSSYVGTEKHLFLVDKYNSNRTQIRKVLRPAKEQDNIKYDTVTLNFPAWDRCEKEMVNDAFSLSFDYPDYIDAEKMESLITKYAWATEVWKRVSLQLSLTAMPYDDYDYLYYQPYGVYWLGNGFWGLVYPGTEIIKHVIQAGDECPLDQFYPGRLIPVTDDLFLDIEGRLVIKDKIISRHDLKPLLLSEEYEPKSFYCGVWLHTHCVAELLHPQNLSRIEPVVLKYLADANSGAEIDIYAMQKEILYP